MRSASFTKLFAGLVEPPFGLILYGPQFGSQEITMSDAELVQVPSEIDEQLETINIGWLRLATADFEPDERKKIRDRITSNEDRLMYLLERKLALRRK